VDATLRFTDDELFGVFWSARSGSPDLYAVTRPALAAPLTVSLLANVNDPGATDLDPAVSSDGSFLLFSSARGGGAGGFDLYEAPRLGVDYGTPVRVTSLASTANEQQPTLVADTELFFSSDRTGSRGCITRPARGLPPTRRPSR
jgi:OOP family OmpA-OmpF porin